MTFQLLFFHHDPNSLNTGFLSSLFNSHRACKEARHCSDNQRQGGSGTNSGPILVDSPDKGVTTEVDFWGI